MPQIYRFGGRYRSWTRVLCAEEKAHIAKVARENVKGHSRRRLRDWNRCQDREDQGDVTDADSTTDDRLEADRVGKTAVRVQCCQQAGADDNEHPAEECWDNVFGTPSKHDACYECNTAKAKRQSKDIDTGSGRGFVLACLEKDYIPIYQQAHTSSVREVPQT